MFFMQGDFRNIGGRLDAGHWDAWLNKVLQKGIRHCFQTLDYSSPD